MTDLGPTSIRLLFVEAWLFCCQSAAILGHLPYHIGNFHPLFTKHVVGSVGHAGLLLRFPCFSELVCRLCCGRLMTSLTDKHTCLRGMICLHFSNLSIFSDEPPKEKLFFEDGIPGDLLALAPKQMAELLFCCVCKEIAYVREPIAHKGGYLIPAFKKGDPSLPQNYRSLFVSSVIGKAIHAMYRQELAEVFRGCRLPFQIGGLKGHGITQAALVLQSFQRQAIRQKKSVCFFFLDVATAFYRLARQDIIQGTDDKRSPKQLFAAMNLSEAAAEFEQMVSEPGAIDVSEAPDFLKRLFQEFCHQTWFCLRNDSARKSSRRQFCRSLFSPDSEAIGFLLQITMSCPWALSRQVAGAGRRCWCWCCKLAVHLVEAGCWCWCWAL